MPFATMLRPIGLAVLLETTFPACLAPSSDSYWHMGWVPKKLGLTSLLLRPNRRSTIWRSVGRHSFPRLRKSSSI